MSAIVGLWEGLHQASVPAVTAPSGSLACHRESDTTGDGLQDSRCTKRALRKALWKGAPGLLLCCDGLLGPDGCSRNFVTQLDEVAAQQKHQTRSAKTLLGLHKGRTRPPARQ